MCTRENECDAFIFFSFAFLYPFLSFEENFFSHQWKVAVDCSVYHKICFNLSLWTITPWSSLNRHCQIHNNRCNNNNNNNRFRTRCCRFIHSFIFFVASAVSVRSLPTDQKSIHFTSFLIAPMNFFAFMSLSLPLSLLGCPFIYSYFCYYYCHSVRFVESSNFWEM